MNKISILKRIITFIILFETVVSFGAVFSINDVSVHEEDGGTRILNFRVSLYGPCQQNIIYHVDYATSDNTASAGSDYVSKTGTIDYSRNSTKSFGLCGTKTVSITIKGDTTVEPNETFRVRLYNARSSNSTYSASISDATGIGTIKNDDSEIGISAFKMRYKKNIKGNMKIIGNTVLARKDSSGNYLSGTNATNSEDQLRYVDTDSDSSTFNSSLAVLEDSAILTPTAAKVKWAGLYWTGYLHTYDEDDIEGSNEASVKANTKYKTLTDFASIDDVVKNHTVKFKIGNITHDIATHAVLGEIKYKQTTGYTGWSYGCFAEVTSLMTNNDPRGTYSVANIPSMEGATNRGNYRDGLGNSGAWTLVVIYENSSAGEKTRNATVFDGFVKITSSVNAIIDVAGFRTPKSGNVDSTLSVFASKGDKYISGDQFIFKNIDGDKARQSVTLSSSNGDNNYFNSSITGIDNRTPNIENNNGIDIHTDQVGTSGYNIVSTNQTKAQITLTSTHDVYYPVMLGFATELYMPKLCYDYSALLNGELMQKDATDRTFIPHKNNGILQSKVFIRSLEGDFPYVQSRLKTSWNDVTPNQTNPPIINFSNALVQNPHRYQYLPSEYIDENQGEYYIGVEKSGYKGVIEPFESLYAISNFEGNRLYASRLRLDVQVTASLALDKNDPSSLTEYIYSTSDGTLEICPGIVTYNPKWYQFNVEKYNSAPGDYRLNTQVTGTDYILQAVAYTKDGSGKYTVRTTYTGTIEVEMLEVPSFKSLGSYDESKYKFDRICEDSSNRKNWGDESNNTKRFVHFNNSQTEPISIKAAHNRYAMRNAGIRMWVLVKDHSGTKEIVGHNGTDFKTVYQNNYAPENKCQIDCTSGSDETCYQCLKTYYSQPICSRDNFSVRPYAIELNAINVNSSGKEVLMSKNDSTVKNINLISGDYNYTSSYRPISNPASGNVNTVGYYFRLFANSIRKIANNTLSDMDEFFGLEFNSNKDKCRDASHIRLTYKQDKPNISPWKIYNDNIGDYNLELIDRNWTMVDQARYKYKTFSGDDCIPNSASSGGMSGLAGCNVQSYDIDKYTKIPVKLIPYKIDVSSVGISSFPNNSNNWVYMNDLSKDKNMAVRFFGTLRSLSRDGKVTSNFTDGCAASDVNLTLDFNSVDFNTSKEKSIIAKNLKDDSTALTGPNININRNGEGNSTIYDLNNIKKLNIPSSSFKFENNGTMPLDMRFNITKICDKVVDPIEILFKNLSSAVERFKAWFNGVENSYAPKDKIVYDRNITFLYGRVLSPIESIGAIEYKDGRNIYLIATAYTSNPIKETNLHKDIFDANNDKVVNSYEGVWCTVEAHSATDINGRVVELTDLNTKATIMPDTNILFDSVAPNTSGISSSINIAYPKGGGRTRPYTALIEVNPDIWLKYHPTKTNGNPEFSIKFKNLGYNWAGKGKTGNVIKQTISPNSRYKVNW